MKDLIMKCRNKLFLISQEEVYLVFEYFNQMVIAFISFQSEAVVSDYQEIKKVLWQPFLIKT